MIVSAHYDSRGSFGSTRAPGGDDDGSGVAAILGIAHVIARKHIAFKSNVELVAFVCFPFHSLFEILILDVGWRRAGSLRFSCLCSYVFSPHILEIELIFYV